LISNPLVHSKSLLARVKLTPASTRPLNRCQNVASTGVIRTTSSNSIVSGLVRITTSSPGTSVRPSCPKCLIPEIRSTSK
jgi:hypothetical protein